MGLTATGELPILVAGEGTLNEEDDASSLERLRLSLEMRDLRLVFDSPVGQACRLLESLGREQRARALVITEGVCPEYLDDLWDYGIMLLANEIGSTGELRRVVRASLETARFRSTRPSRSPLPRSEREVLRLVAQGLSNKDIARTTGKSARTVENALARIYTKVACSNRVQAALYYWSVLRLCPMPQ